MTEKIIEFAKKNNVDLDGVFVRIVALPKSVRGLVVPNDDCTHNIYINAALPTDETARVLMHELGHIINNHLHNETITALAAEEEGAKHADL